MLKTDCRMDKVPLFHSKLGNVICSTDQDQDWLALSMEPNTSHPSFNPELKSEIQLCTSNHVKEKVMWQMQNGIELLRNPNPDHLI